MSSTDLSTVAVTGAIGTMAAMPLGSGQTRFLRFTDVVEILNISAARACAEGRADV